jgi:hypothetical protein
MSNIEISHTLQHGTAKFFVTAPAGTHHSTIAAAVLKYSRGLVQPPYVSSPAGLPVVTKPGVWCAPTYSGEWRRVGSDLTPDTHTRKTFTAWPVPAPAVEPPAPAPVLYALWNGGYGNYSPSEAPRDTELFTSLQAVKTELWRRREDGRATIQHLDGSNESTGCPCVGLDSEFLVWTGGDGTEYPETGTRVFFGPRGGVRQESF